MLGGSYTRYIVSQCEAMFYRELYQAQRWCTESRFWTPMIVLDNGCHVFIGDIIDVQNPNTGKVECRGKVVKFYTKVAFL